MSCINSTTVTSTVPLPFNSLCSWKSSLFDVHSLIEKKALDESNLQAFKNEIDHDIAGCLIDVVGSVSSGLITIDHFKQLIDSLETVFTQDANFKYAIADSLWFWGIQISPESNGKQFSDEWSRLCTLTKEIGKAGIVEQNILKTTLELNLLVASGLWKDEQTLQKRLVKLNTSLYYRQQKYNILREETEGYAKLLGILSTLPSPPHDPSLHIKNILSIVGYFDLDPNRVLDIVLEVMEQQYWNPTFLVLLKNFRKSNLCHILGFKLTLYHDSQVIDTENLPKLMDSSTPKALFMVLGVLLTDGILTLENILSYLYPTLESIATDTKEQEAILMNEIKNYGVVNLSSKGTDTSGNDSRSEVNNFRQQIDVLLSGSTQSVSFNCHNQFVGILTAALVLRNWDLSRLICDLLRTKCQLNPFQYIEASMAMIRLIDWRIEKLIDDVSFKNISLSRRHLNTIGDLAFIEFTMNVPNSTSQCHQISTLEELVTEIFPMLEALNHFLSNSSILFTKICRLLSHFLKRSKQFTSNIEDHDYVPPDSPVMQVVDLIANVLLPTFSKIDSNPAVAASLWQLMSELPFQLRYKTYELWKNDGLGKQGIYNKPLPVVFAEVKILHGAKANLKRLSKENTKQIGRQIAKYIHSCSLVVYEFILSQIEVYDNMIPFVVDALKYTTDLARDILSYALVSQLHKDSEKLKPGDTHLSHWFSSLSKFIASFYKRYPTAEIRGILHYLLQKLSTGESLDLLVLKEILVRMGGCETILDVSNIQLEGLAGGRNLQSEVMGAQVKDPPNKKAIRILREVLFSSGTAFPLLVLIAQVRSKILFDAETTQLKLISYLYDTSQDVLMQFTDFLVGGSKSIESIAESLPKLDNLLGEVGLAVPVAFQLIRPIVRAALQYGQDYLAAPAILQDWHPFSPQMKGAVIKHLPAAIWTTLSPELFMTFWSLSLYDLSVPVTRYEQEIRRLKDRYNEIDSKLDDDKSLQKQRKQDMSKFLAGSKALADELDQQKKHVENIKRMINSQKDMYFSPVGSDNYSKMTENIMQYCVHSRVLMSPLDAVFCSQFFLYLHTAETPKFSTIHFLHRTMRTIAPLIFCTTEYEAGFIGFFISDLTQVCNRWISSKVLFSKEAEAKSCFRKDFESDVRVNHDQYAKVYNIWQQKLKNNVITCLKSSEYMHVRSALVFLSKVAQNFPTRTSLGKAILQRIDQIEKDDKGREDLKVMSRSLGAILKRRQSSWVDDEAKERRPLPTTTIAAPKKNDDTSGMSAKKRPLESQQDGSTSQQQKAAQQQPAPPPAKKSAPNVYLAVDDKQIVNQHQQRQQQPALSQPPLRNNSDLKTIQNPPIPSVPKPAVNSSVDNVDEIKATNVNRNKRFRDDPKRANDQISVSNDDKIGPPTCEEKAEEKKSQNFQRNVKPDQTKPHSTASDESTVKKGRQDDIKVITHVASDPAPQQVPKSSTTLTNSRPIPSQSTQASAPHVSTHNSNQQHLDNERRKERFATENRNHGNQRGPRDNGRDYGGAYGGGSNRDNRNQRR